MTILVDKTIPFIDKIFNVEYNNVIPINMSDKISKTFLQHADTLIIRSTIKINNTTIPNSYSLKFIGSMTTGIDHIDLSWIKKKKIKLAHTPGCNAIAVTEYVLSVLFILSERYNFNLKNKTIGIVGLGNIGKLLHQKLKILNLKTLTCDPYVKNADHNSIDELIKHVDILSLHVPLRNTSCGSNYRLINKNRLYALKENSILINTSRGDIIDNFWLKHILRERSDLKVVLDVWDSNSESIIDLIERIEIATPHIAGTSIESKIRSGILIWKQWNKFFKKNYNYNHIDNLRKVLYNEKTIHNIYIDKLNQQILKILFCKAYDIEHEDMILRKTIKNKYNNLKYLRNRFLERHEWSSIKVLCKNKKLAKKISNIGFNTSYDE